MRRFESAIQLDPRYVKPQMNLAKLFEHRGETNRAIIHLKAILAIEPAHAGARAALTRLQPVW